MHTPQTVVEAFELGQLDRALQHFEALDPETQRHPLLLEIVATIHGRRGDAGRELAAWARLAERCPDDERIGLAYATRLMAHGQVASAVAALEDQVSSTVDGALLLANGYLRLRRNGDAIQVLQAIRPHVDPPGPVMALEARARFDNDERALARALLEEVGATDPRDGPTTRALGRVWRHLLALQQAIKWFERAVAADPDDRESWEALASCFEQVGSYHRAEVLVRTIVERFGPTVGSRRLELRLLRHAGRLAGAREVGEALLAEPVAAPVRRSVLLELAQVEQRSGDPDRAFARAVQGNELARREFAERGFPTGTFNAGLRRVLDQADRCFLDAPARASSRPAPVFLVGVPRSGTTLTQQMLQAHPDLVGLDETDPATRALRRYCRTRPALARLAYPDRIAHLEPEDWRALRCGYWDEVEADGVDLERIDAGARLLDKLPLSLVRLQWLSRLFPDAHVVVCLRDPRDTTWSNFLQDYQPNLFAAEATDLVHTAELVEHVLRLWLIWRDDPPLPATEVRYEQLVADPRPALEPVFAMLGLPFDDAVLATASRRTREAISTPSYHDVTQPLYQHARGRWRSIARHLAPVLPTLEEVAVALGYPSALASTRG